MNSKSFPNDRQIRSSEITPPPELVQQWMAEFYGTVVAPGEATTDIATRAAQWGAAQELEACCHYFARDLRESLALELRAARRPKPPSLKEQALDVLQRYTSGEIVLMDSGIETIRRALEQLDD
jgi:hypothetical protein